jgi:hypothetical protein
MAKQLVLQLLGADYPLFLSKVERSDLYGFIETEILDSQGRKCAKGILADDGQTLIGAGGTAFASLSADGSWLEKSELTPVDVQGKKIEPISSSYDAPIPLVGKATIDEYLSHNIRAVYQLTTDADLAPLLDELKKGTIFTFPYSYRGGLEADAGFLLLAADGTPFLAVGTPTNLQFVGLESSPVEDDAPAQEESDDLDFGMM